MSSGLMDTSPGGENTQYESINTFNKPHSKESSEVPSGSSNTKVADPSDHRTTAEKQERGEQTAENIRFGESISEHGFGGETGPKHGGGDGGAGQEGGFGGTEAQAWKDEADNKEARGKQGYGEGSGVGA